MSPPPDGPSIRIDVPCDLAALHGTRDQISRAAAAWGFTGVDDLDLVVSELVTNAIVHGGTPSVAMVRLLDAGYLEVAVRDDGPGAPHTRSTGDTDPTGRGLRIVDAVSSSWGVDEDPHDGKTVWARLGDPS